MGSLRLTLKEATSTLLEEEWLVPSKLPESLLEGKLLGSSSLPKLPESLPLPQEEGRSRTGTGLGPWLSGKLGDIRNQRSCSSANCPSSAWSGRLPRISRRISGSKVPL